MNCPRTYCFCSAKNPKYTCNNRPIIIQRSNDFCIRLNRKVNDIKKIVFDNISQCKLPHTTLKNNE